MNAKFIIFLNQWTKEFLLSEIIIFTIKLLYILYQNTIWPSGPHEFVLIATKAEQCVLEVQTIKIS